MPGDKLKWLDDVTIKDWVKVTPNQNLGDKVWRVRNIGTTTWGAGYVLAHDSGNQMSAPDSVALPSLAPNEEGDVVVPGIVAPSALGIHSAHWIPRNATGKPFGSNLTIVINVDQAGGGALPTSIVAGIAQELSGYGVGFMPDSWEDVNAQRVRDAIVPAAQRLYNFAVQQIPAATLNSPQDVFRRFFPRRVLRRNRNAVKFFNCADPQNPSSATCATAYAWNDGTNITFYSNAIFNGFKLLRSKSQSPVARFAVGFTTEFLVLHELSHSHPWAWEYLETSRPLIDKVAAILPDHKHYPVESTTIASAGFIHAARSQSDKWEFSTDAIANWLQESFTTDADGFGDFRRTQMDAMVSKWLSDTYGPIHP